MINSYKSQTYPGQVSFSKQSLWHLELNSYKNTEIFDRKMALEKEWYNKGKNMNTLMPALLLFSP